MQERIIFEEMIFTTVATGIKANTTLCIELNSTVLKLKLQYNVEKTEIY